MVVGDVVGRGLTAATAMGQLRSAVRALAVTGVGPRAVIGYLDTFVEQVEAAQFATLIYAEIEPGSGRVTVAAAGHLPPVIVTPGRRPSCSWAGAPRRSASAPGGCRGSTRPSSSIRATAWCSTATGWSSGAARASTPAWNACWPRSIEAAPDALARALEEDGRGDDDVCVLVFTRHR